MEASALTHAGRRGLLVRRSPLVRLQGDEGLVALIRDEQAWAFEVLFDRYQGRLLAFCRHMLPSEQDAEDVLQDVFVSAHKAILADNRHIKVKPWLYRIARNRCLNHLRRPVHEGSDEMMDEHPFNGGTTTAEQVQTRQELRELLTDVKHLPETQRTALLLREVDALSYSEIAQAMETTVPAVKSLLVRARITLAESSQSRLLTCGEVQVELAEAAEGLAKATGPVRHHVKACQQCKDFRDELRSSSKALAALFPLGPLAILKEAVLAKLGAGAGAGSASGAGGGAAAGGAGACGAGGAAIGGAGASGMAAGGAIGGAAAAGGGAGGIGGGLGLIGGAIGTKAAAGVATAAIVTVGAVEVKRYVAEQPTDRRPIAEREAEKPAPARETLAATPIATGTNTHEDPQPAADDAAPAPVTEPAPETAPSEAAPAEPAAVGPQPAESHGGDEAAHPHPGSSGEVTAVGTHEGPVAAEPAPSGSASGQAAPQQPPPEGETSPEGERTPPASASEAPSSDG